MSFLKSLKLDLFNTTWSYMGLFGWLNDSGGEKGH